MLPAWFVVFAVFLRLYGGTHYAIAVVKKTARPNPITWFFWALTALITFAAQVSEGVGWSAATTLAIGLTPLAIFVLSLKDNLNKSHFTPATIACAISAAIGVVLWLNAKDPIMAIAFSIIADALASLPTVMKAYKDPASEYYPTFFFSMASVVASMLTVTDPNFASLAFPAYIFLINLTIIIAGLFGKKQRAR